MDLKDKTVLVHDTGLFLHIAEKLSKSFGTTMFFNSSWKESFSRSRKLYMGDNIPGITRVDDFWKAIEPYRTHPDDLLICFFDLHFADLQQELVRQGFKVWGSRWAEELELCRQKY